MMHRLSASKVACAVIVLLTPVFLYAQHDSSSSTKKPYVLTGNEASLAGLITFTAKPPEGKSIDMSADPACYLQNPNPKTEDSIVNGGNLVNVLIFVKESTVLDSYTFKSPTTPATFELKGCRYVPRVIGIQVGQPLKIFSTDPTYHNSHPVPKLNVEWNQTLPPGVPPLVKTFARAEIAIRFRCNQHPWERAYLSVFNHPFFAVSDEFGVYEIKGLPPGRYTVVAWHERFGEKTVDVTLGPGESRYMNFAFDIKDCVGYGCPKK